MKRGSEICRDDDQKKLKESPKESANGGADDLKPATGSKKSRGEKKSKKHDKLPVKSSKDRRSQRLSSSTSQASSSDKDAATQSEDDQTSDVRGQHKNQRKRGQKKTFNHPIETNEIVEMNEDENEDGHLQVKAGSRADVARSHRSRRSSVHFTTKDMISVSGDISIHQVMSSEEDVEHHKKVPPTPAALSKDKNKTRRSSKVRSGVDVDRTQDKALEDDAGMLEEHRTGQSQSDSTAEGEKETIDQGRKGKKKESKTKQQSKQRSSQATLSTSLEEHRSGQLQSDSEAESEKEMVDQRRKGKKKASKTKQSSKQRSSPATLEEHWSGRLESDSTAESEKETVDQGRKGKKKESKTKQQSKQRSAHVTSLEEHRTGQSQSDSTAESEKEIADQGESKRGKKKGSKTKQPSKRRSSPATSTSYVAEVEASDVKKRRYNRRQQEAAEIASGTQSDASDGNAEGHTVNASVDDQDVHHSPANDQSARGSTPEESPTTSSSVEQDVRSMSTGSILKVSNDWGTRRQKNKKYSILFTEKPLPKAYIIKPDEEDGVRRTRRQRVRPLEYWRNERPLYERRKSGGFALAGILSPEQTKERVSVRSLRPATKRKGLLPVTPSNISMHATPPVGTSSICKPTINVVNPDTKQEVAIDAVATSKMLKFTGASGLPAKPDDSITISKALSQKAFSAGVLTVRPFEEKGSQLVRRDTMVFYVVRGKIAMTLHETSQILQNGDWFFVPKGNVYNIKNLRKDEAKLTFFQLKSS